MTDFPKSASEARALAIELVRQLKHRTNTCSQPDWKVRNFKLLDEFCRTNGIDPVYSGAKTGPECLWDFVGYLKEKGMLITGESEFSTCDDEAAKDFDKLLYGSSPIKLMICRIDNKYPTAAAASREADRIQRHLEEHVKGNCTHYPPGSVFILYCVWWAEEGGPNRDFAYILQVNGEPNYVSVRKDQHFEPLPTNA
jgi:hypothetical protein